MPAETEWLSTRVVLETEPLSIGSFRLRSGAPCFGVQEFVPERVTLALPRVPLRFTSGRWKFTADPNLGVLLASGVPFRHHEVEGAGAQVWWVEAPWAEVDELVDTAARRRLGAGHVPVPLSIEAWMIAALLGGSPGVEEDLRAHECGAEVLRCVLSRVSEPVRRRRERGTAARVREILSSGLARAPSLDQIAAAARLSKFQVSRAFKEETGFTIHSYLVHLRLRRAMVRLVEGREKAHVIAADLGFASESHLSNSMVRHAGVRPSALRAASSGGRRERSELLRMISARLAS